MTARAISTIAAIAIAALAASPALAGEAISGKWQAKFKADGGTTTEYFAELEQKGETVTGALVSPRTGSRYPLAEGTFKDGKLALRVPTKRARVEAKLAATGLEGTFTFEDLKGVFSAVRAASPVGVWKAVIVSPDGREREGKLEITEREGKLAGKASRDDLSLDLKDVKFERGKLSYSVVMRSREGAEVTVNVESLLEGDRLKGTWKLADGSQSGEVRATRAGAPAAAPSLASRYVVSASLPDGNTFRASIEPKVKDGKLEGTLALPGGAKIAIAGGTYRDGRIEFSAEVPYEGVTRRVKISGTVGEKGVIAGAWTSDEGSGDLTARPVTDL